MELAFGKHFKDATNLLLMMDHDSGYVEGTESSSSNECDSIRGVGMGACKEPDNFLLSEDALLEKPDISFNLGENLPYEIDTKDYEESRKIFFSPEVINSSVQSQNSSVVYSGLEYNTSSDGSAEIPLEPTIIVSKSTAMEMDDPSNDNDILTITLSESDMSLEQTFEPVIIENGSNGNCSLSSPLRGFSKNESILTKTAVALSSYCVNDVYKDSVICNEQIDILTKDIPSTTTTEVKEENIHNEKSPLQESVETEQISLNTQSTNEWSIFSIQKSETPSKSNPLSTVTNTFDGPRDKRKLTLVFSKSEKENGYSVKRKFPSMTPEKSIPKPIDSNISPDIFGDEMINTHPSYFEVQSRDNLLASSSQNQMEEKYVDKLDQKLLKRTQKGMSGVLPPPSVTTMHISVHEILSKFEENKNYHFLNGTTISEKDNAEKKDTSLNSSTESNQFSKSLLLSVDIEEARNNEWPDVYNMRCHGLYYNCGKISEEIVDLCDKYQKRFVGAETQSTCTVFETQNIVSPSKKKMIKSKWSLKSPGRRLSHLARRRITFSSANLQAGGSSLAGSRARQILVDAKKIDLLNRRKSPRKTPRKTPKKTPSKSPKIKTRTPSSSAKKKLAMRFRKLTGEFEKSVPSSSEISSVHRALFKSPERGVKSENSKGTNKTTKRALFQSPNRDTISNVFANKSQDLSTSEEKNQSRRALFTSPRKNSPLKGKKSPFKHALKFGFEKKRKRSESDDVQPSKFQRSMSMDVRPSGSTVNKSFPRAQSELNISLNRSQSQNELSEQHKKKLLWAVSGALQGQNIINTHPQWKVFASVLARVTRRFFVSQMAASGAAGSKLEGGTSERMHRIARFHVISVIKGKSADEIVNEHIKSRTRVQRPQGYVAPEDFNHGRIKAPSGGKENVFQDRANTIESWEKKRLEQMSKPATTDNKVERIRKVINFGDDR